MGTIGYPQNAPLIVAAMAEAHNTRRRPREWMVRAVIDSVRGAVARLPEADPKAAEWLAEAQRSLDQAEAIYPARCARGEVEPDVGAGGAAP